jgi:hypothetical protein
VDNIKIDRTEKGVSRDSSVGIVPGYGLDDWGVGVRVPVGSSPRRPARLWGPPTSYPMDTGGSHHGGKGARAWSWPLTSNYCWGQENVDLYIHSPICLHGVVLNQLSTGTTLPLHLET